MLQFISPSTPCAFTKQDTRSDLKSRLGSFLPAIRAANESLERERAEGRIASWNIEVVDKDVEQYIEMVSVIPSSLFIFIFDIVIKTVDVCSRGYGLN